MKQFIVVTADIIDSRIQPELASTLKSKLESWVSEGMLTPFSLSRGDEIQAVCELSMQLPRILRKLRFICRPLQIRIGIGVGTIDDFTQGVNSWEMNGTAFFRARNALQELKGDKTSRTSINTDNPFWDLTMNTIFPLIDYFMQRWTEEQWEAVQAYESYQTYQKAAEKLHIARQNVQKRCQAANWSLIRATEERLGKLIEYLNHEAP